MTIQVLLADDDAPIRAGISAILQSDPDIEVVAQAADGRELAAVIRDHQVDVALIDVRMPHQGGLDAIAELRADAVDAKLVVLTTFAESDYLSRALDLAVDGYLLKSTSPAELIAAVHAVMAGGAVLSPPVARWVLERSGSRVAQRHSYRRRVDELSERQRDVLALVGEGASNAEIAQRLYLSEATVKGYVSEILARLEVSRRVQAAIAAHEAGIVTPQNT